MPTPLVNEIIAEIDQSPKRAIPFSRYMELALYHPLWGYYQRDRIKLGKKGDFFTNAHVGSILGQMLGRLFYRMTKRPEKEEDWVLVEMGAGDGRLTEQVVKEWIAQGGLPDRLHVYLLETSPYHRRLQQKRLAPLPPSFHWPESIQDIPTTQCIFFYTNELVDAFPVNRIKKEGGSLWQAYVTKGENGELKGCWLPLTRMDDREVRDIVRCLSEGQIAEVSGAARKWISEVATWIKRGIVLTIDYGGETNELLMRTQGTLRGYHKHRLLTDLYQIPGEMDLTAHVDFTALRQWGEDVGLLTLAYLTQSDFLLRAGVLDLLPTKPSPDPFSPEAKRVHAIRQLVHPQAMGESFRVLLQAKGLDEMIEKQLFPNL